MVNNITSLGFKLIIISFLLVNSNCKKDKDEAEFGDQITGTVWAPDGSTPIAEATVYIPVSKNSSMKAKTVLEASSCPEPAEDYIVYTCTNVDGSFSLDVSTVAEMTFTMRITKGSFIKNVDINKATSRSNLGNIEMPANPEQGAGNFAVVTGAYDRMEDILAKLGMGEMYYYQLDLGTETFDLYDGNNSLPVSYPEFLRIFDLDALTGERIIYNYDMVFINCGNAYEFEVLKGINYTYTIRDYVEKGGKLYVTDQSYDFVEQAFPEYIDFSGSNGVFETDREYINEAEIGLTDITSDATINDSLLAAWLSTVSCLDETCLLNPTTVNISGFWSGWTVMDGAHLGKASSVKIWITGPVEWEDRILGNVMDDKPLTVSFIHGDGKVIYTSYHNLVDYPSAGFWPQERILQYLVFE